MVLYFQNMQNLNYDENIPARITLTEYEITNSANFYNMIE